MTTISVTSGPVRGGCRQDVTGGSPLAIEGPTKAGIRQAVQRSHGVLLRRAGIHPEFPSHQMSLNKLATRAVAENEGDVDTLLIVKVGFYWYAFGGIARTIRELKWNTKTAPTWTGGNFEVMSLGVIGEALRLLKDAGHRVAVIEIPRDCPESLDAPPVPWEIDKTPRVEEPHPMDVR